MGRALGWSVINPYGSGEVMAFLSLDSEIKGLKPDAFQCISQLSGVIWFLFYFVFLFVLIPTPGSQPKPIGSESLGDIIQILAFQKPHQLYTHSLFIPGAWQN